MSKTLFSTELESWSEKDPNKTVGDLQHVFGEKSFAILFLIFMFIPALPIPTGGITNFVLIPAVIIAALQMTFGRRTLWLPKRMANIKLGEKTIKKGLPFMIRRIKQLEKLSRPRKSSWFDKALMRSILGVCVLVLAVGAWIAPPFSWLDTLPSMGIVLIALAIMLEDIAFFIAGILVGTTGVSIILLLLKTIIAYVTHLVEKIF